MSDAESREWVEALRALAESADPGPWGVGDADDDMAMSATFVARGSFRPRRWPNAHNVVAITFLQSPNKALADLGGRNARFIAAAREGVPRLCAEVESLASQRDDLVRVLRQLERTAVDAGPALAQVSRESLSEARRLLAEIEAC
jgi:hypothetical protein